MHFDKTQLSRYTSHRRSTTVFSETEARAQLSSTIIYHHEPFDQGLYAIDECTPFTYADDTQLLNQVEHAINADLKKIDEWYEFNQMERNHSKYQVITFEKFERNPVLTCEGTVIPTQDEMELLGV